MRRSILFVCILLALIATPAHAGTARYANASPGAAGGVFSVSPAAFTTPGVVNALLPLGDGRMLAAGSFVSIDGIAAPNSLALLDADGEPDPSFHPDADLQIYEVYAVALQTDGKIVIAGWITRLPSLFTYFLLRLNADGSIDEGFDAHTLNAPVYALLVDGDKLLAGGNFTAPTPRIARLNPDGSADTAFSGVGAGPDDSVRAIARQSSGKYILAGGFSEYSGAPQNGLARIHADGSLDAAFVPGGFRPSVEVAVLADDSVLVGGENVCGDGSFAWYSAAGAPLPDPDPNPDLFQAITSFLPLPDGGFLIGGWSSAVCVNGSPTEHEGEVWRYAGDGSYRSMTSFGSETDMFTLAMRSDGKVLAGGQGRPDSAAYIGLFDGLALIDLSTGGVEKVPGYLPVVGDEAEITSLSRHPDGSLLVAGNFSHANGLPRFGLARMLANNALDSAYAPYADFPGGWSNAVLALPDGRALAGFAHDGLYLISASGSLTDLSALNDYDRVSALALQPDGMVLVGSDFGLGVRRLLADFSAQDPDFIPGDAYGAVYALAVQNNGDIFVGGNFEEYNNAAYPGLVRLDPDGFIDAIFAPPVLMVTEYLSATISSLTPLADGRVLVGGDFTLVGGEQHAALIRLNLDGSRDTAFSSPDGFDNVNSTCILSDGSLWAGGTGASYFRQPALQHLDADGAPDPSTQLELRAAHDDGSVNALLCDTGAPAWAGGIFSLVDERPFYGLARFLDLKGQVYLPLLVR